MQFNTIYFDVALNAKGVSSHGLRLAVAHTGTHLEAQTRSLSIVKIRFYIVNGYYVKPYLYYGPPQAHAKRLHYRS